MTGPFHPSGFRIAGRYEVAGRPLIGGMGIVYLCFDHQEQRPVALKTFKPEYLPDRTARDRFLQEGETWVRLGKHSHIVRCYEVSQDHPRPEVYLVLELVAKEQGRRDASLRSWLTPGRPLPVEQALLIALQIVRGMRHATDTIPNFVHRDLKPENVLVGVDRLSSATMNRVRVTDFGLVKGLRAEQLPATGATDLSTAACRLTRVGALVGTPLYMAPEQWRGTDVAIQADIYALGCILGEMVTGQSLVQGKTLDELRRAHQGGQALVAARSAPAVRADLLGRCLATEPAQRYADWVAVEAALAAVYRTATGQPPPEREPTSALSRAERVAVGWSYSNMGLSYLDLGQAERALGFCERAQQVGQEERERELEAAGLGNLGLTYAALGETRRAIGFYEQHLAIARDLGDRRGVGNALGNLGLAYVALDETHRAIGYYEGHLAIARELGDRRSEGLVLGNLGVACARLGDARRAIAYYEQALAIDREIGDRRGEGQDLGNLGNAYASLGDVRRAIGYYERALAFAQELGDRRSEGNALGNLGVAHKNLGDVRRAIGYYEQALAIDRELGDLNGLASTSFNLARLLAQQGRAGEAVKHAEIAAEGFARIGHAENTQMAWAFVMHLKAVILRHF